jgi:NTP pyrophosphatase (non-canonical NTP hydrolase)
MIQHNTVNVYAPITFEEAIEVTKNVNSNKKQKSVNTYIKFDVLLDNYGLTK